MWKSLFKSWKRDNQKQKKTKEEKKPDLYNTVRLLSDLEDAVKSGNRAKLFRIYRGADDDSIRFAAYENLIRSEEQISFGGMEWIVLDKTEDRQLLLSKYALKGFVFGQTDFRKKHYEGENYYYTIHCAWEMSQVRSYLNNDFLKGFSEEDKNRIIKINGDRVFILSLDEYLKYAADSVAVRAAFSKDKSEAVCWSRTQAGSNIEHGEWKTTYYTFGPRKSGLFEQKILRLDLDEIPTKYDLGKAEFDTVKSIRPAMWIYCGNE